MKALFGSARIISITLLLSAILFLLVAGIILISGISFYGSSTKHNAETIIEALEKFKQGEGQYPETLDKLVSNNYLRKIPSAGWKKEFDYYLLKESQRYILSYRDFTGYSFCYDSTSQKWGPNEFYWCQSE